MAKCPVCKVRYTPTRPMQTACSWQCSLTRVRVKEKKKAKAALKEAREKLKTRRELLQEVQKEFNAYIRARDDAEPCISCGRHHTGQYHAGHYRTVKAAPELRFDPMNCHKQCSVCNNHLSGNLIGYRQGLIKKIGQAAVESLEGPHEPKKYIKEELEKMKKTFRAMKKALTMP